MKGTNLNDLKPKINLTAIRHCTLGVPLKIVASRMDSSSHRFLGRLYLWVFSFWWLQECVFVSFYWEVSCFVRCGEHRPVFPLCNVDLYSLSARASLLPLCLGCAWGLWVTHFLLGVYASVTAGCWEWLFTHCSVIHSRLYHEWVSFFTPVCHYRVLGVPHFSLSFSPLLQSKLIEPVSWFFMWTLNVSHYSLSGCVVCWGRCLQKSSQ